MQADLYNGHKAVVVVVASASCVRDKHLLYSAVDYSIVYVFATRI